MIPGSSGVESEGDEIEPITINRGGFHIGEIVSAMMRAVRQQEAEYVSSHPVCASLSQSSSNYRDSEGKALKKHPLSDGDRARNQKSSSVTLKKVQTTSLD